VSAEIKVFHLKLFFYAHFAVPSTLLIGAAASLVSPTCYTLTLSNNVDIIIIIIIISPPPPSLLLSQLLPSSLLPHTYQLYENIIIHGKEIL
jgi:hypothetical protein